ncbi:16S rRNA (cytosine(967)-C(5))-methyltransferase [Comamonas serinivorans]|uniref:16S rRNA (cytosine(967)-C(5))-methyltransferase n=1 Tax=Comamonas serinivorans TaxID=1082851 RepID=A0A1Y0ES64_9BURK|nr:16S rRNA (cytosine(967)-C(5))-methyltransferase RsmB [Comamonas serinivorans]ARU06497.1 16S rRNA (cytosine(967)-C(5))-methyltransferase [Comamonas serinivorans]
MSAASPSDLGPPLWRLLQATQLVVCDVRKGRSLTAALATVPSELRSGVQALSFQAMRQHGRAQAVLNRLAARKPPEALAGLLITALALLLQATPAYADHVLVDQAVTAAQRHAGMRKQAGFVNACLRRFLREREQLLAELDEVAQWNHPAWWVARVRRDHPQDWQAVLQASQQAAPLVLRVNRLRIDRPAFLDALAAAGVAAQPVGEAGVRLARSLPVTQLPGYADGWFSVQDLAAQLAAPLLMQGLNARQPLRLLDACAAPGGKTAHLLEVAPDAELLALEIEATRVPRIHDNLARLQLNAEVRCADAADVAGWWDGQAFDGILLDAPCSASGIVRRHPDVPWLRRAADIEALVQTQRNLLERLWPVLRPGGTLVYATCSVFKAEGEDQIRLFLQRHSDAQACAAPGHLLPGVSASASDAGENSIREHDGFFYARLHKRLA